MFVFPDEARWNEAEDAVEFTVQLGEYEGLAFIGRRVLQAMLGAAMPGDECLRQFHLNRATFERIVEAKIRARELDGDANIRITGRDLRAARR
ncbi:MAG: DUF1488 family protein [Alphaproteobacteria bacterium]|nr:DUF1488 family protein [Alphaproteobacteria bacterium]